MGSISALIIIPALAALVLGIVPFSARVSRLIGIVATSSCFLIAIFICLGFHKGSADFQFVEKVAWIAEFGVNYEVGVDGISLFLVLLTTAAALAVILSTTFFLKNEQERLRGFTALFLFLEVSLIGVYVTLDLILFYVFFELMLVPSYLLINGWGGSGRTRAAVKFVMFTAIGSVLMLSSIVYLGWLNVDQAADPSFSIVDLSQTLVIDPKIAFFLFWGFAIAFAVKTPIMPFHNWSPSAYAEAPSCLTAFMSAVMAKAGLYGFLRFVWPLFPQTFASQAPWLIGLLSLSIVYSALVAWSQRDMKRLLAYSSISHLGICALGVVYCSADSMAAAVLFMVAHGVVALGSFLTISFLESRQIDLEISRLGGLAARLPRISFLFFVFLLGSIALPLSGNFIGEFLILSKVFEKYSFETVLAATSVIIGAVYMLSLYRRSFFGNPSKLNDNDSSDQIEADRKLDLSSGEFALLLPLAALVFVLGMLPQYLLDRVEPATKRLESLVKQARTAQSNSEVDAPSGSDFFQTGVGQQDADHLLPFASIPEVTGKSSCINRMEKI